MSEQEDGRTTNINDGRYAASLIEDYTNILQRARDLAARPRWRWISHLKANRLAMKAEEMLPALRDVSRYF